MKLMWLKRTFGAWTRRSDFLEIEAQLAEQHQKKIMVVDDSDGGEWRVREMSA